MRSNPKRADVASMDPKQLRPTSHASPWSKGYGPMVYDARGAGKGELRWVGTVINPKTMRPYLVYWYTSYDKGGGVIAVPASPPELVLMGYGYLEDGDPRNNSYLVPARITRLPRVHTPNGVAFSEEGLGTCLYVGMAAVATYLNHMITKRGDYQPPRPGDGVCSGYGASSSARRWWEKAVEAGLAEDKSKGGKDAFALPLKSAIKKNIVLDLNPLFAGVLVEDGFDVAQQKVAKSAAWLCIRVLSLNLSEVVHVAAREYFYALAFRYGATLDQVRVMRDRAERECAVPVYFFTSDAQLERLRRDSLGAARALTDPSSNVLLIPANSYFYSDTLKRLVDESETSGFTEAWSKPRQKRARRAAGEGAAGGSAGLEAVTAVRENPTRRRRGTVDYEEIGAALYPDLVDLDD